MVSFLNFKEHLKTYRATQFDTRPTAKTIMYTLLYKVYLKESSCSQTVVFEAAIVSITPAKTVLFFRPLFEILFE